MKRSLIIYFLTLVCLMAAGRMARAQDTNDNSGLDFKSFQLISRRSIFDPSRRPDRPITSYVAPKVTKTDSFTLVGTLSYEHGQYAFFDGNSFQFRKTLKPDDSIAGYKILQIAPDYVTLAASSNKTINLPVGTKMKRREGGPWTVSGVAEPEAESTALSSTPDLATGAPAAATAPPSAAESDVLKRLMLKRMQEK